MARIVSLLIEIVGVTLAALGGLATNGFISAETPAEAIRRGVAKIPTGCEAGFLNHGAYTCWYTISAHPLLFLLSISVLIGGGAIFVWGYRRW